MATISPNVPPEIAKLMLAYRLSKEDYLAALQKIRKYVFCGKSPSEKPEAWLVFAQTGSGKSNLTAEVLRNNPNTCVIDSDAFKAFNPRKEEIIKEYPTLFGYLTGMDAYDHRDDVYKEALEKKYNILCEIAPSTKEGLFTADIDTLKSMGYIVKVAVLACSKINSAISIHERFEGQIEAGLAAPKLTDLNRHNDSYEASGKILEQLVESPKINEILVYKRGCQVDEKRLIPPVLLTNDRSNIVSTFIQARQEDELLTMLGIDERINNVIESMNRRNAPKEQFSQFENICRMIDDVRQMRNLRN